MARIPENVINDIRNRSDIVDIVSHYVPLNKKGKNFEGICPFHDDHDPSMNVSVDKQIFHCFVCGAGGNTFGFVQRFENVNFPEAVKRVAELSNIPFAYDVSSYSTVRNKAFQPLYDVLNDTIEFCSYELFSVDGKPYLEYLKNRGVDESIIKKFSLGFNPKENRLYEFLKAKKHKDEDMVSTNVVRLSQKGLQDVFYNRIMIPIHDGFGNPVGFSARIIDKSSTSKYINSAETPIYIKGNLLFNYHRAKDDAKKQGRIFVVEGAMDVIAFAKAGIDNVLATLGTACTDAQVKLFKTLNATITLFYDGDRAGQDATYKVGKLLVESGLNVEIVKNDHGLDPDEIVEKHGKEELIEVSKNTISWIDFLLNFLRKKFNVNNYSEKKEYAKIIGVEISRLQDQFERDSYYEVLKQVSGFDLSQRQNNVQVLSEKNQYQRKNELFKVKNGLINAQYQIISLLLISKQANECYRHELGFLPTNVYHELALQIIDYYRNHDEIVIADLLLFIKEEDVKKVLLEISNWELAPTSYREEMMQEAISKIKNSMISKKINTLLKQSNQISDPIQKAKIADEVVKLRRQRGD